MTKQTEIGEVKSRREIFFIKKNVIGADLIKVNGETVAIASMSSLKQSFFLFVCFLKCYHNIVMIQKNVVEAMRYYCH